MADKTFYDKLTHIEKDFADCNDRHIMVQAGPGAGKSYALLGRIERLIRIEHTVDPSKILVLAFNRMAAQSLKKDLRELARGDQVEVQTLHEHCLGLMRHMGLWTEPRRFLSLKEIAFMRKDLLAEHPDFDRRFQAYCAWQETRFTEKPSPACDAVFVKALEGWLRFHRAAMFEAMTSQVLQALRAGTYASPYAMILVDEYQDVNEKEREIIRLLAADKALVVIGDEDQSIYAFRHAHSGWTDAFRKTYGPEYTEFAFHTGRRCPKRVAAGARNLIEHNAWAQRPALIPRDELKDGAVCRREWPSMAKEISGIADLVLRELSEGLTQGDICILVRNKRIGFAMQKELCRRDYSGKPLRARVYCSDSVLRGYADLECLAYMALLVDDQDPLAWRILIGEARTGINYREGIYRRLWDMSAQEGRPVGEILARIADGTYAMRNAGTLMVRYAQVKARLAVLADALAEGKEAFRSALSANYGKRELFERIEAAEDREAIDKLPNDATWLRALSDHIRQNVNLPPEPKEEEKKHVRIMTWHTSKGLSARLTIILTAIEEPALRAEAIEENRRLFYVAVTRCKGSEKENEYPGKLVISYPLHLTREDVGRVGRSHTEGPTMPSRFVDELAIAFDE